MAIYGRKVGKRKVNLDQSIGELPQLPIFWNWKLRPVILYRYTAITDHPEGAMSTHLIQQQRPPASDEGAVASRGTGWKIMDNNAG